MKPHTEVSYGNKALLPFDKKTVALCGVAAACAGIDIASLFFLPPEISVPVSAACKISFMFAVAFAAAGYARG